MIYVMYYFWFYDANCIIKPEIIHDINHMDFLLEYIIV